jgi:hypothetical protein
MHMPLYVESFSLEISESIVRISDHCYLVLRCGPFAPALEALQDARMKKLLGIMVTQIFHISDGIQAIEKAQTKGVLKVQIIMQKY